MNRTYPHKKIIGIFVFAGMLWCCFSPQSFAAVSPHPLELYERGQQLINRYDGQNSVTLLMAQDVFLELISKYPDSPFGYLGMSHIYRIDAYLGDEHYDLEVLRSRALPFALHAMRLGPSIRAVHENYVFFEKFFEEPVFNDN